MLPFIRHIPPKGPGKLSARDRILNQWRGTNQRALEKGRLRAKSAGSLLPDVMKSMRFDKRRAEAEVLKVWNQLIDPDVIAHAQPVGLRNGTLFVAVDNSVWLSEIVRYRRHEILERLQHSFGPDLVTKIAYKLG